MGHTADRPIRHLSRAQARLGAGGKTCSTLGDLAWPDVAEVAADRVLVVPLGSTEQHGPHLPLSADSHVAVAVAERLAERRTNVVVAPALAYGSSGEHAGFAGTLSIGADALKLVLVELARSADAFAGIAFVSGHGGNAEPVAGAVEILQAEGRRVLSWAPRIPHGDAHAGRTETSLMLAIHPDTVRLAHACRGDTRPLTLLLPMLRQHGVAAVSANGVLGDPEGASADEGATLLEDLVDDLDAALNVWCQ